MGQSRIAKADEEHKAGRRRLFVSCRWARIHADGVDSIMTGTTAQFKKQLPRNLSLQVVSFVVQVGIGIWLVPYLVGHLGRAAYGLIPIAGAMTQYVALISQNISISVNRFLTIALQRNDRQEANRIFNTAFFSYLGIALIQIPMFWVLIHYANSIFTIPEELYRDAILLLSCSAIGFLINLLCSVFGVPIYANNRLDISRGIDIARQVLRVVGVVTLFLAFGPALRYVGYVDLAISITTCLITFSVGRRLAPMLTLDPRSYDWRKVRQLTGMGGWLFINQVGTLLFLRVDVWICNRFVGAEQAGDYAAVLQWSNLIRTAGSVMAGVIAPMTIIYYARSEIDQLIRLNKVSVRVLSLALVIPISLMCVFSAPLLRIWLGDSFGGLWPLMVIMLCHLVVNVGVTPLFTVWVAVNRVRWPALITLIAGTANLVLAILLAKYVGWGIYGVAVASAVVLTLVNAVWTPVYGAIVLQEPWRTFFSPIASSVLTFCGISLLGIVVRLCIPEPSRLQIVLLCGMIGTAGLTLAWWTTSPKDRHLLWDMLPVDLRKSATKLHIG
jgi:O-antigen/teichoic acid export membrane protein